MNFNILEIGLLAVLIICFIIQLLYYWIIFAKPYRYIQSGINKEIQNPDNLSPVSIIINVKKSNNDLYPFLSSILEQDYPEFEVIAVTDEISDSDEEALIRLKNIYPNLYITHVPDDTRNISRKKLALSLGIKASKYDKLLFTECDCFVMSKSWIFSMARNFSDKKTIVLGFSAVDNAKSPSQKYIAYDYFFSNLQMICPALFNYPYAGNGRNMAYTKEHFVEQKGFVKYRILQQGEDDLFINEISSGDNTMVELSPESLIITEISDFRDWNRYKFDRMSTKRFYKRGPVAFWRIETYVRIAFFAALIACIVLGYPYKSIQDFILPGIAFFCFIVRFISQYIVINKTIEQLKLEKFHITILLFDLFQPFINLYFFVYRLFREKENYTYRYENR